MANKTTFKQKKLAKTVFGLLCDVLDENDVKYTKQKGKYGLNCSLQGDDLPVHLDVVVDIALSDVLAMSVLPFSIPKERRDTIAVAVCEVNTYVSDGCFDFQWQTGEITFRISANFSNSIVGKELLDYLVRATLTTVDEFNEKFLFLSKSELSAEQIVAYLR